MAQRLEVLGVAVALAGGVLQRAGEAEPVQGELGDAPDRLGRGYKLTLGPA